MELLELRDDQDPAYEHKSDHLYHVQGSLHFIQAGNVLYVRLLFQDELDRTVISGRRRAKSA